MGLTLLRQEDDIRQSDVYDDTIAPTLADYETNPADLEADLNNIRSMLHTLQKRRTGNWYDDLLAPSTFENGAQRGVDDVNQDLHDLERKRVLVDNFVHIDVAVPAAQNYVVLALSELPSNTTAAVGAVTTLGTVAAAATTFGAHNLDEVAGANTVSPKNLGAVVDSVTHDPLTSSGRQIYALFQTENATDGHTMTGTTPNRAQVSFVRLNAAGTDLEACPVADIQGLTVHYTVRERKAMEDFNEEDFLTGIVVDLPTATSATRQNSYDNQGVTPVDVTTNSTLDLEGAGLSWEIRDDLEARLFAIIEGSAGGTSEVQVAADVDTFNVDAVVNDFANGATFNSSGARDIQVGLSDGVIDTLAGDLEVRGTAELFLDDGNQAGSTWAQTQGIKLSETTAEWDAFETAFGETSLLDAIVQAYNAGADPVRAFHVVQSNVAADADVGGPSTTANNLDVNFPDAYVTDGILNTILYVNGRQMRPGVDAAANFDYYPGTTFAAGDVELKFERKLKTGDTLISVYNP